MPETHVIAGAGLAGAKAAEALRDEGFEGRIVLVGDEPELPYERPPLSKDYLRGESPREQARVHPDGFYADHDIELLTGTAVTAIDTAARSVTLTERRAARLRPAAARDRLGAAAAVGAGRRARRRPPPARPRRRDAIAAALAAGRPRRDRRRRLDRHGGGGLGAPEGARGRRSSSSAPSPLEQRARPRGRARSTRSCTATTAWSVHTGVGIARRGGRGPRRARGAGRRPRARRRPARLRPRRDPAHRAGRARRARGRERRAHATRSLQTSDPHVFAAGDIANAEHPFYGRRAARRALGQRAPPAGGRGQGDARQARGLRQAAVLLLRPVRRRHGVPRPRRSAPTRFEIDGDAERLRVRRLLAARGPRRSRP